jgi:hypothetical protein
VAVKNRNSNQSSKRFNKYERRLAKQRIEAERASNGKMGPASPARRIDPVTGEMIGPVTRERVKHRPSGLSREAGPGRALRVLARAGRSGAAASSLGETETNGMAVGLSLVAHGFAAVTRSNRFIVKQWQNKAIRNVSTILRQPSVEFKLGCLAFSAVD